MSENNRRYITAALINHPDEEIEMVPLASYSTKIREKYQRSYHSEINNIEEILGLSPSLSFDEESEPFGFNPLLKNNDYAKRNNGSAYMPTRPYANVRAPNSIVVFSEKSLQDVKNMFNSLHELSGSFLKQLRDRLGVSFDEIVFLTRISRHHVLALEDDKLQLLPAPIYVRGFVMSYLKCLRCEDKISKDKLELFLERCRDYHVK